MAGVGSVEAGVTVNWECLSGILGGRTSAERSRLEVVPGEHCNEGYLCAWQRLEGFLGNAGVCMNFGEL